VEELLISAIRFHLFFLVGMVVIALVNLYFISTCRDFSKKVKKINPVYYGFFASAIFCGIIILTVYRFSVTYPFYLMIGAALAVFIMSMKLFKKYKYGTQSEYREFAKKKYILDIVLIVASTMVVYAV